MALNIKDPLTERLAAEVAQLAGESKTRAVRTSLEERRARLVLRGARTEPRHRLRQLLEQEVWPALPEETRGRRVSREERDQILGFGPEGV